MRKANVAMHLLSISRLLVLMALPAWAVQQPGSGSAPAVTPPAPIVTQATPAPESTTTLRLNVDSVLVPVVVRDSHGDSVDDLQQQDFAAFDNGKPWPISRFLVEKRGIQPKPPNAMAAVMPQESSLPDRVTVFVFDDMHLSIEDLAHLQEAGSKALDAALTGGDMAAVVSTSGKVNSGLTRDGEKLADAVKALRANEIYRSNSADCPKIGYYQADQIVNWHNNEALQEAVRQIMFVCSPRTLEDQATAMAQAAAQRALTIAEQSVLTTYAAISEYVRRMAKLPGQHLMVLVSSGFLPIEQAARSAESKLMNLAAECNVTINALNARGLYVSSLTASQNIRNRDPEQVGDYQQREMTIAENAMGELADATGGTFFHNNNDLEAGFQSLLKSPETVYLLELSLDKVKHDGAWHRLTIKVDRPEVRVQARKGYAAPTREKESHGKREPAPGHDSP